MNILTNSFSEYNQHACIEKLFTHTDKNFYLAGEILWFKLYAVDATFNKPLGISKVAYVEVLDTNNKPVLQAKIAMNEGVGNGSLFLPLTLSSGNYKFRAYTNWMKNGGADCFFEKIITVVNAQKVAERSEKDVATSYDVQFFPEGGNLVTGLESKVAFKVVDNRGKGVPASGYITEENDTLLRFATSHAGMGNFQFKPMANHNYKATIQVKGGSIISKALPAAYTNGLVMRVNSTNDKVQINVQSNNQSSAEVVYLLVHTGSSIKVAEQGVLKNGSTAFTFNDTLLGDGISHITIFNVNRQPLCERLYFKRPKNALDISLLASNNTFDKRSKVDINVSSNLQAKEEAKLSMSVYRLDSIQSIDENTINTYLLLSSELRGGIEDISYYLKGESKQTAEDLNNLVLVNGWRRFKWEEVLSNSKPLFTYVPEYNGHIITGRVINSKTGRGAKDIEAYLSAPGSRTQFATALSSDSGMVKFEMKDFYGSSELIAQTKEDGFKMQIDAPFSDTYTSYPVPAFQLPQQFPNTLVDQSISMQVQNIYTSEKRNQFYLPALDTTAFYVNPDSKYNLDNYTRFSTMEEVLREYVALVNLTKRSGTYHIQVYDKGHEVPFTSDPLVLLDGVPVLNLNKLLSVDPLKLRSLEVVQKKYFLGPSAFDGILNWKSYNGDLADLELNPTAIVVDYDGLQAEREFYSPVYTTDQSSHVPDFRNVLYWNPNIKLRGSEQQVFSFYTSDLPGTYAVIVQGIGSNGLAGSTVNTFEVNE